MPYKERIRPKSRKEVVLTVFFILFASVTIFCPFYGEYKEAKGRNDIQAEVIEAIDGQKNVKLDKLIITTSNGKGNDYSVVFPAEKWEG